MDSKIARQTAKLLLNIGAVTFRFNPPYTFTSGIKSPIYLDNRLVMSYPLIRKKITSYYCDLIKEKIGIKNVDWISATATAAIPQGCWVSEKLNLPMVFVRPTSKSYGKGNKMEGILKKGSEVLIIEDHISTAESVVGNAQTIRSQGSIVNYCLSTTTYETEKSKELLNKNKINLISLTTGRVIVEVARKNKMLNSNEEKLVDLWFEDPINWGVNSGQIK